MLTSPFPDHISFCLLPVHPTSSQHLHSAEEKYLNQVKSSHRIEQYRSGRICAREALSRFGIRNKPVIRDPETREPIWPDGFSGAITHSKNWAAAAVGKKTIISGIGIDLEDLKRNIDPRISRHVCTKEENDWLHKLDKTLLDQTLKLIFSAKESIFKAFFPSTKIFLHFHDAKILINNHITNDLKSFQNSIMDFEYTLLNKEVIQQTRIKGGKGKAQFFENSILTSLYY